MDNKIFAIILIFAVILVIGLVAVAFFYLQSNPEINLNFIIPDNIIPNLPPPQPNISTISPTYGINIASWNLQIFGDAKAENQDLMQFYENKIKQYDIFIIQEIRDIDGSSFNQLCNNLQGYTCFMSERAGTTISKEQYGVFWKTTIDLKDFTDYTQSYQNQFERPPLKFTINSLSTPLTIYTIHTKPDNATFEIAGLEQIITEENIPILIMGDLNAGCAYFNRPGSSVFANWTWLIGDEADTTSTQTNCPYDRIIANPMASEMIINSGIDSVGITEEISDHYLVWATVN